MSYWKSFVDEKDNKIYENTINLLNKKKGYNTIKGGHYKDFNKNNDNLNDI